MKAPADYYQQNAEKLISAYEAVAAEEVHKAWKGLLPPTKGLVLEVGAGSGRDAAWLASMGHEVIAVEPCANFRSKAKERHANPAIRWIDDSLPQLKKVRGMEFRFDVILVSAVWMHLSEIDSQRAFRILSGLLRRNGILIISYKIGQPREGQPMRQVLPEELRHLARKHALEILLDEEQGDFLGRPNTWHTFVFRLPDDGTGALPLLRHIIVNDRKSSTYKLALLRSLLRIADGNPGAVLSRNENYVELPFGLVALYWLKCFKPLVLDNGFLQLPEENGQMGFDGEAFRSLQEISPYDLRPGTSFQGNKANSLFKAIKGVRDTIHKMPAHFITWPNMKSNEPNSQVFQTQVNRIRTRPLSSLELNPSTLAQFGSFFVPLHIWEALSHYATWIEPVILQAWCDLMRGYNNPAIATEQYLSALNWLDPKRQTQEVAKRAKLLNVRHCVWTGDRIARNNLAIDHCLPFRHWPNNDLWNLLPTRSKVNLNKSDKLPSAGMMDRARERIIEWWDTAWFSDEVFRKRFIWEASIALPGLNSLREPDPENLFQALQRQRVELKINQQLVEWEQSA
jgi:SAM-dependent methyltransferase